MALDCNIRHPLQHDGTSQQQRFLKALDPSQAKVDEFSLHDWMRFAWHFAEKLNYFSTWDDQTPEGNWQAFMKSESEIEAFLKDAALAEGQNWMGEEEREKILKREPARNYEPHLALFLSFLKLLQFSQKQLNGFTQKHLDFYYQRVLQLSKKPAVPDRVNLVFELARNAQSEIIPSGTPLDGGKDAKGNPMVYQTTQEITVNKAKVAILKSLYHQPGAGYRYAEMTNSVDGLGTEFGKDLPHWNPFGNNNWPGATMGFALASHVLFMKEGNRVIKTSLSFRTPVTGGSFPGIDHWKHCRALLSGEKGWIDAGEVKVEPYPTNPPSKIELEIALDQAMDAVVPNDPEIHQENFITDLPVLRLLFDVGNPEGYALYSALARPVLEKVEIDVSVEGMKDLQAENDAGKLDVSKPFYPFSTTPARGSNFFVGNAEILSKNWKSLKVNMQWKGKPLNMATHYQAFSDAGHTVSGDNHFTIRATYLKDGRWYPEGLASEEKPLFDSNGISVQPGTQVQFIKATILPFLIQKGINMNKAVIKNYLTGDKKKSTTTQKPVLNKVSVNWSAIHFNPGFTSPIIINPGFSAAAKSGFLRLTLTRSFLHKEFPTLYSLAMIRIAKGESESDVDIPKEPYTPEVASISIDYSASAENTFFYPTTAEPGEKLDGYQGRSIQLFHEHPFGQAEQHVFLKEQAHFLEPAQRRHIHCTPEMTRPGELYIGLENARGSDTLNLLFEAVEGSEDPMAPVFTADKKLQWYALVNNEWQSLDKDYLAGNNTNNFLQTGIVQLQLPAAASNQNTLLEKELHWIKVVLPEGVIPTSVCKLIAVYAQAAEAIFTDNDNDLSHLQSSLPAETISKFIEKPPLVKGVVQPSASFGGAESESDEDYYLRVSERLRHKNRAVNIFDYERLVLQQFPEVYKVKCLSHTSVRKPDGTPDYFELNPGHVSLIVVPDIRNRNSFDPLEPRASRNLLARIDEYLRGLCGMHVAFVSANPSYEAVKFDFKVRFHKPFDPNAYLKVLNNDLIKFLSPWAFHDWAEIHFGGAIHKSQAIAFVENLPYVDFVSKFRMIQPPDDTDQSRIRASSEASILVSNKEHKIELLDNDQTCNE